MRSISYVRLGIFLPLAIACMFLGSVHKTAAALPSAEINISTEPRFPRPESSVTVSLEAYTVDTAGAVIQWYVNGVEHTGTKNERSMTFTTGSLGTTQTIRVDVLQPNGGMVFSTSKTITPVRIDLIAEADTYVPPFYRGRALPAEDLPVRFIALPQTGKGETPNTFTYLWKLDNAVLFGGPIKGKYAADITMPRYANHILSVSVTNATGDSVGGATARLTAAQPELHFYEYSALRGISERVLNKQTTIIGDEMTVYAEPYYIAERIDPQNVNFTWKIDGEAVEGESDPHTITLRRVEGSGTADIGIEALTKSQMPKYLRENFTLMF